MEKNPALAAICSREAAKEYGLNILEENVQNSSANQTRFVAISKALSIPDDADKISLCFSLNHTTGSLYSVLGRFAMLGLNLTKIESRPIPDRKFEHYFEYFFYLDFIGSVRDDKVLDLICALSDELPGFSFLATTGKPNSAAGGINIKSSQPSITVIKKDKNSKRLVCFSKENSFLSQ